MRREPRPNGSIPGTRTVSMTHNQVDGGNQLIIATGDNRLRHTVGRRWLPLAYPTAWTSNQPILGVDSQRKLLAILGLADAMSWNFDNESAESAPDRIVGGNRRVNGWCSASARLRLWQNSATDKPCVHLWHGDRARVPVRPHDLPGWTTPFSSWTTTASRAGLLYVCSDCAQVVDRRTINGRPDKALFAFTMEDKAMRLLPLRAQDGHLRVRRNQ